MPSIIADPNEEYRQTLKVTEKHRAWTEGEQAQLQPGTYKYDQLIDRLGRKKVTQLVKDLDLAITDKIERPKVQVKIYERDKAFQQHEGLHHSKTKYFKNGTSYEDFWPIE